jgi:hypothetical protein
MSSEANKERKKDLENELDSIQNEHNDFNIQQYNIKAPDLLPGFGQMEVYDYDMDINNANKEAIDYVTSLVNLYLGDSESLVNHEYIQKKLKEDSRIYGDSIFLDKMSKRILLAQLKLVDNGSNNPRSFETINQTIREIRENNKEGRTSRTEIEKDYKEIRKDFGLNTAIKNDDVIQEEKADDGKRIIDPARLNDEIDRLLKEREAGKNK